MNVEKSIGLAIAIVIIIAGIMWLFPGAALTPVTPESMNPPAINGAVTSREVSMVGTFTCLPHADTTGPQTLECAFGIKEAGTGDHYALDTQFLADKSLIGTISNDAPIRVDGLLTPIEMLSSDHWRKYAIKGILSARTILLIEEGI